MKKVLSLLLALTLVFVFAACKNGNNKSGSKVSKTNKTEEQVQLTPEEQNLKYFFSFIGYSTDSNCFQGDYSGTGQLFKNEKDDIFEHIVDFYGINVDEHLFITDDGSLYHFSFRKRFSSNNLHYKKIETDLKFVKFIDGFFVGTDNKIYDYDYDTSSIINPDTDSELNGEDLSKVFYVGGKLRYCKISGNRIYSLSDNECVYTFANETIEFAIDNTIKTDKGIYRIFENCINETEVNKYADVEPIYGIGVTEYRLPFEFNFVKFEEKGPRYITANNYLAFLNKNY